MEIIKKNTPQNGFVRAITITASDFLQEGFSARQLSFWEDENDTQKDERLQKAIDDLNYKFGENGINFGPSN
jgi:hypothetical protein